MALIYINQPLHNYVEILKTGVSWLVLFFKISYMKQELIIEFFCGVFFNELCTNKARIDFEVLVYVAFFGDLVQSKNQLWSFCVAFFGSLCIKQRINHGVPAQVLWWSLYKAIIAHGISV